MNLDRPTYLTPDECPECGALPHGEVNDVVAELESLRPNGSGYRQWAYSGETDLDTQQSALDPRSGLVRLQCPEGHRWTARGLDVHSGATTDELLAALRESVELLRNAATEVAGTVPRFAHILREQADRNVQVLHTHPGQQGSPLGGAS